MLGTKGSFLTFFYSNMVTEPGLHVVSSVPYTRFVLACHVQMNLQVNQQMALHRCWSVHV